MGWRDVPVDASVVGPIALKTMPRIRQVFIESGEGLTGDELERELFIVRKLMEKEKVRGRGVRSVCVVAQPASAGGGRRRGGPRRTAGATASSAVTRQLPAPAAPAGGRAG